MNKNFKERLQGFAASIVTAAIISVAVLGTSGASLKKTVDIFYKDIKICVDGSVIEPKDASGNKVEPFIMDGTTYLPVRAVASALDKDVDWDGATSTVYLGEKPSASKYSRDNPAPIGTSQKVPVTTVDSDGNEVNYFETVTVKKVIRGEEAYKLFISASDKNQVVKEGYDCVWVLLSVHVDGLPENVAADISYLPIEWYSGNFEKNYDTPSIFAYPDGITSLRGIAYSGGTIEGYVGHFVKNDDKNPMISYGQEEYYPGATHLYEGAWFSLTK